MAELLDPDPTEYGRVVGRFTDRLVDDADPLQKPQRVAYEGLNVLFTPEPDGEDDPPLEVFALTTSTPPETFTIKPLLYTTDADGYVCAPLDDAPGAEIPASTSLLISPTGWRWRVEVWKNDDEGKIIFPRIAKLFRLDPSAEVDITALVSVPPDPDLDLEFWEQAVAQTMEARDQALEILSQVEEFGGTNNEQVAAMVAVAGPTQDAIVDLVGARQDSDVGYDLVILAGQSNVSGRGTPYDTRLDPVDSQVYQFGNSGTYADVIAQAFEPLAMHDTPSGIGPGLVFARWYAAHAGSNRRVLLVPTAHGGTPLVSNAALGWRAGVAGNLYANSIAQTQKALAAAGPNARVAAVLWIQGETDSDNGVTGSAYQADLDAMINAYRSDLGEPNLPFVVGQMVPEYLSRGTRTSINAVHAATPTRRARTAFALSPLLRNMNDGNHFNAAGQRIIGRSMFEAYLRILNGEADPSLPVAPDAVTGLVAAPDASSVMLSWSAAARAGAYYVEQKLSSASTWTRVPGTSTPTTAIITDLIGGSSYDFRVTAVNQGGAGASATVTAVVEVPVAAKLVDAVGVPAYAALGTRQLVSAWSGPVVRVRRSSDSMEQDIGLSSGELDTTVLLAFSGSGSAYVTTWYDQSGNGRNFTQATASAQPRIVNAGAVETSGGKPCLVFDGTDDVLFRTSPGLYAAGAASILAVLSAAAPGTSSRLVAEGSSSSNTPLYQPTLITATNGYASASIRNDANASPLGADTVTGPSLTTGVIRQYAMVDSGTNLSHFLDGAAGQSKSVTRAGTLTLDRQSIGASVQVAVTSAFNGRIGELVLYAAALTSGQRANARTNQQAFFGTP